MVDVAEAGDLDSDIVTRVVGLHRLVRGELDPDDISISVEGASRDRADGSGLHDLGDETIEEEEDKPGESVVPQHDRGVVHHEADQEHKGTGAMDIDKDGIDSTAELGQGKEGHDDHSELENG